MSSGFPLWVSDELESWPEKDNSVRFQSIAALYSEFIGVTTKGELHQWKWNDIEPYKVMDASINMNYYHPKTQQLNLLNEKITQLSATLIRASVATETGRIATWMDELLGTAGVKLEHVAVNFPEFQMDKIISLHTCTLYTVARTESNELYWWGVLPFGQRKKLWDKFKARTKKPIRSVGTSSMSNMNNNSSQDIVVGAQVTMKKCPMYQPGAIGFTVSNGVPKVGQLLNAAWDLTSMCRFKLITMPPIPQTSSSTNNSINVGIQTTSLSDIKEFTKTSSLTLSNNIISGTANTVTCGVGNNSSSSTSSSTSKQSSNNGGGGGGGGTTSGNNKETADRLDMPPPPSPASSTCSDTGSVVTTNSHKRQKRMAPKDDPDNKKDEELWMLKDVVFVEDVRSVPVGRVLKVDGDFAAVKFPSPSSTLCSGTNTTGKDKFDENSIDAWQDCRLLKKDDLQVVKSTTTSRGPDCFQKIPRRIVLNTQLSQESGSSSSSNVAQLLTLAVDSKGIHAIMKCGTKLHYSLFNLNTGRQELDSIFPTDINSFLGVSSQNVALSCTSDNNNTTDSVLILRDGNKTIYPIAKDCIDAIRDPNWLDLPPIKCIAAASLSLPLVSLNLKSQVALIVLAPEIQLLMPHILRCDIEGVKQILQQFDNAINCESIKIQIQNILSEHTDGNRNILHACVSMCSPSSNKDNDADISNSGPSNSSSSTPSG